MSSALAEALIAGPGLHLPVLVNVDPSPDVPALVQRCDDFANAVTRRDILIVTILTPPDSDSFSSNIAAAGAWPHIAAAGAWPHIAAAGAWPHIAAAGAWAFTRHAALAWAPRGVRLNMIGYGVNPPADPDPLARGRSSAPVHAPPASIEDVVRTVHAMARWPSMTGQFIRLGGA